MELHERSDEELLSDVTKLVGSHRELTAKLVAHLAEIEDRRLHLLAGFSSMFDFCTRALGLGEGEAFRRILAARLGRRFPVVYSLLASGAVNLSTLELVREWLTEDNHQEVLAAVSGKSKREVQAFLAACFPRLDRPTRIRRATVDPLSDGRFAIEFTASHELCEKLERCRDLMSHSNPSRDLAPVVERAVDLLLEDFERTRLARTKSARHTHPARPRNSAGIARATRRAVFERDGVQCTFVAENGRRCGARAFLELDHVKPRALGGTNEFENLRVRCRAHNQLWAEQVFGRERIERRRHFCQKKWTGSGTSPAARTKPVATLDGNESTAVLEKARSALRGLGFHDAEARRAIAAVAGKHHLSDHLELAEIVREAVLVATAA